MTTYTIKPLANGRFKLQNEKTLDTTDQSWGTREEAEAALVAAEARLEKIASDMRARTARANATQAAIDAIRPTVILTNGQDR